MLETVKHVMSPAGDLALSFANGSARVAKRVGGATADVARRIGPKRALIGLAVIGVVVGGTIAVIRYLRARDEADGDDADDIAADGEHAGDRSANPFAGVIEHRKLSRAKRKAARAMQH